MIDEGQNKGSVRTVYYTDEFMEFYQGLDEKVQKKMDYVISVIKEIRVVHVDFVKKLIVSDFYEMRVSVGTNEYRTILFSMVHENIIESDQVILLNGFLKKSSKDYEKQIKKAEQILIKLQS